MGNDVSVTIDKEAVDEFVAAAIMNQITQEQRDKVIAQAVEGLMRKTTSGYGQYDRRTVLQVAFDGAAAVAARQIVEKEFEKPEVQAAISEILSPLIMKLCEGDYDGLADRIGEGVASWLRERKSRD